MDPKRPFQDQLNGEGNPSPQRLTGIVVRIPPGEEDIPAPDPSDTASSNHFGARSVTNSSQNQSTRELITPKNSPVRPPRAPLLGSVPTFPFYRDSISIARNRATPSPYHIYRVKSSTPPSPWPFRNATPRASLASVDVSALSSSPPSMQARTVSEMSDADYTQRPITPPTSDVWPAMKTKKKVTIQADLPSPKASSILSDRPPTPMPSPILRAHSKEIKAHIREVNERQMAENNSDGGMIADFHPHSGNGIAMAHLGPSNEIAPFNELTNSHSEYFNQPVHINRGISQSSRTTRGLSQIHRMATPDLAHAQNQFFQHPRANLHDSSMNLNNGPVRTRGLVRRPPVWDTTYINDAFGHPRVLVLAAVVFGIIFIGLIAVITTISAYAARGVLVDTGLISWAILNIASALLAGAFLYAVYMRNRDSRVQQHAELLALRARASRHAGELRDLESQVELANMSSATLLHRINDEVDRRVEEILPQQVQAYQNNEHVVVRVITPNAANSRPVGSYRPATPDYPPAPPPTPDNSFEVINIVNLSVPAISNGVSPSHSETSILTQLCEGVMANGTVAATREKDLSTIRESGESPYAKVK